MHDQEVGERVGAPDHEPSDLQQTQNQNLRRNSGINPRPKPALLVVVGAGRFSSSNGGEDDDTGVVWLPEWPQAIGIGQRHPSQRPPQGSPPLFCLSSQRSEVTVRENSPHGDRW